MLAALRERSAGFATIEEGHEPFFFTAEVSSTRLDSYSTHMLPSSLKNYARDAQDGTVPFMNSHRTGNRLFGGGAELPLGRSLEGKFSPGRKTAEGPAVPTVTATFYTVRGLRLNDITTDDFIEGIRTGIIRDVSIGFTGGRYICDIDGEDMLRSEKCDHFPGMEYVIDGKRVVATAGVDNAGLGEVSAVYRGSTPGAMIFKATRMAEEKRFDARQLALVEDQYRILLPGGLRAFAMNTYTTNTTNTTGNPAPAAPKEREMPTEAELAAEAAVKDLNDRLRSVLASRPGQDIVEAVTAVVERAQNAETELARIKPLAADGETYRNDTIAACLTEGKRAFGEGFNEEHYRSMLAGASIDAIKTMRANFEQTADKLFPKQRQTTDDTTDVETPANRRPARGRRVYAV